ncbi:MAG TPA: CpsB/CapC family capsule biosynthesis tyrosine phosphatase [Gaiellaceae bacterium]
MVDTHCHLLPGLDDGPRSTADAVDLARELVAAGVTTVLCTPHYTRQWPTDHAAALAAHDRLRHELDGAGIELATSVAAEVGTTFAVTRPLEELAKRAVGPYVVVEIYADTPAQYLDTAVSRLAEADLLPVFAHPELARFVDRRPEVLDDARARGALVQVLAPGVVGFWGPGVAANAWDLVEADRADLVASDAHGPRRPPKHLARAAELIDRRLGREVRLDLTERRPAALIAGAEAVSA